LIGSNGRTGNVNDQQTQVNFILLNTGDFNVPNAVDYLASSSGSQILSAALTAAGLPPLVVGTVPTASASSSSSSSGLDSGAIAGIVVGGTVALCIIVCVVVYVCCYRTLTKSKKTSAGEVEDQSSRVDKHSNLDDPEEEERQTAAEVEMHAMPQEQEVETTV